MIERLLPFMSSAAWLVAVLRARQAPRAAAARRVLSADARAAEAKRAAIVAGGFGHLHVVIDFDRTITTYLHEGEPGATCHGVLEGRRPPAVLAQAHALKQFYLPIETCPATPTAAKVPHMVQWYTKINAILAACGISQGDLRADVAAARFSVREGVAQLLAASARHGFPVTVFSAGVGDVIEEALRQRCFGGAPLPPTLRVISNRMLWGSAGTCTGFHAKVLHPFNKNFLEAGDFVGAGELAALRARQCVVVVGDGEGDAEMGIGLDARVELRVGLVNDASRADVVDKFLRLFDVVCAWQGGGGRGGGQARLRAAGSCGQGSHSLSLHASPGAPRLLPHCVAGLSDPPLWPVMELLEAMEQQQQQPQGAAAF